MLPGGFQRKIPLLPNGTAKACAEGTWYDLEATVNYSWVPAVPQILPLPHKYAGVPETIHRVYDMKLITVSQLLSNSRDKAWERSTFVQVLGAHARCGASRPASKDAGLQGSWSQGQRGGAGEEGNEYFFPVCCVPDMIQGAFT